MPQWSRRNLRNRGVIVVLVAAVCLLGLLGAPRHLSLGSAFSHSSQSPAALQNSNNWSGYATYANHASWSSVSVTFRVPRVRCGQDRRAFAIWSGVGGLDNTSLAQTGVFGVCLDGQIDLQGWYEWFDPKLNNLQIPYKNFFLGEGDLVTATISATSGSDPGFRASLVDHSQSDDTASVRLVHSSSTPVGNSAECILETPFRPHHGFEVLADFGTATVSGCQAAEQHSKVQVCVPSADGGSDPLNLEVARIDLSNKDHSAATTSSSTPGCGFTIRFMGPRGI